MSKPKIVITGCKGQLGSELNVLAETEPGFEFIFVSKEELPIHRFEILSRFFSAIQPQYCINCAAYTAVDRAESESEMAFLINGEAAGMLASVCSSYNTKFIHISTDYVFNGKGARPYEEDDAVDPVNTYGASKLKGEELTMKHNPAAIIIRTSWVYSEFGNNFVKTMINLMRNMEQVNVVNDQQGSPTYAADLAKTIIHIIRFGNWIPGIYHYSNEGIITWYDFAISIKEMIASGCELKPIAASSYPTPAKRPVYSALNTHKIKNIYKLTIPEWREGLEKCVQKLSTKTHLNHG